MSKHIYFKLFSLVKRFFIQIIQLSINIVLVDTQLNIKAVLFQIILFSINAQFSSIWPIYRTLSRATTPSFSEPGSYGNKWLLRISQSTSITGTSPSDCFVSYVGDSLVVGGGPNSQWILRPQPIGQTNFKGKLVLKSLGEKLKKKTYSTMKLHRSIYGYVSTCLYCINTKKSEW